MSLIFAIRQRHAGNGRYSIDLRLQRPGEASLEANALIDFKLTRQ